MKRRQALSLVGGVGFAALAGCLEGSGGSPDGEDDDVSQLTDSTLEVTGTGSEKNAQRANVTFDDPIRVEGTTTGNNGCYSARLGDTNFSGGELEITVEAFEDKEEGQMCTQALISIDYEATFEFDGPQPDRVVVQHDSMDDVQTVATADRE